MTRELDLCNPFGLERTGIPWAGLAEDQPDPTLCAFIDDLHGLRAGMLDFLDMKKLHGLSTVEECIGQWSPPPQNDTPAYIADVCQRCGCAPDTPIAGQLIPFFKAITQHENGVNPFPDSLYEQALALAQEAL
jgi:hypothetical protein